MTKLVFGVVLLFGLVSVSLPLPAQGSVSLNVCNAGKVDIDVFVSQAGHVSSSHIGPADCAAVAETGGAMGPAYVGFAFVDSHKQWGAARRLDLLPYLGLDVSSGGNQLTRADQTATVRHGNTNVSLPMQLLFRPRVPTCRGTRRRPRSTDLRPSGTLARAAARPSGRVHRSGPSRRA